MNVIAAKRRRAVSLVEIFTHARVRTVVAAA